MSAALALQKRFLLDALHSFLAAELRRLDVRPTPLTTAEETLFAQLRLIATVAASIVRKGVLDDAPCPSCLDCVAQTFHKLASADVPLQLRHLPVS